MQKENHNTATLNTRICRQCENRYDKKEVARIYGKESNPALLGFCSPQCYTKWVTERQLKMSRTPGKWRRASEEIGDEYAVNILSEDGYIITKCIPNVYFDCDQQEINAAYICKAVNNHDGLVNNLKDAIKLINTLRTELAIFDEGANDNLKDAWDSRVNQMQETIKNAEQ